MITIALAGQPNVGKSTVFNMLTGLNQHVGNWPGKTVEQKVGEFVHDERTIQLVDLPGTYSLTANSVEERIARDFIIGDRPDVVIVITNATALECNFYLLAELLMLPVPLVVGINMMDVAEHNGIHIETHVLAAALGVHVEPLVASKNRGVHELLEAAIHLAENPTLFMPTRPKISSEHQQVLLDVQACLMRQVPPPYPEDWVALKLLEGDAQITDLIQHSAPEAWDKIHAILLQHEDAYLDIASSRYEWIGRMIRAGIVRPKAGVITVTDRVDKIATHPFWGILLLIGIFGLVFWLTYSLAMPIVNWLGQGFIAPISEWLRGLLSNSPAWFSGLMIDGIINGAGTVFTFLPILVFFFAGLGFLEDIGYMARSAYVTDRYMHWMGLHGRSFLPLFLGFGCNVPGVMGSRIVENRRARLLTIMLTPLVPCSGRLAVLTFLAPALFGKNAVFVIAGLVAFNLIVLMITGITIHRVVFKDEHIAFIMEMPLYHLPNIRTISLFVWHNTLAFIRKAGSIIVFVSAIVWLLSWLPNGEIQSSLLATIGRSFEPIGRWMGLGDWRLMVALLTSFIAKENTIATLGVLFGSNGTAMGLAAQVATVLTFPAALAFLVVQMTFIPCVATVAVIKQETGAWKYAFYNLGMLLVISLISGIIVYQIARLL
ncbi:MAG: ferrous iron transport protein B [Anaerolineales bacterium]